ncbi:hypothetical protein BH20BAC1_BH20BAC1_25280 [soil metagenome]
MRVLFLLSIVFCFTQCTENSKKESGEMESKIAMAAGEENFDKVKTLAFTFNTQRDSAKGAERKWKWLRESDEVISFNGTDSVLFKRYDTSTAELKKLNADFTNDEYWLLFPYHLVWDEGMTITDNGMAQGPVTMNSLHKLTVQYDKNAGFTPGDMYVIYVDENDKIIEWEFHKSGSAEPSLMTSWEDYEDYNGLKLSSNHTNKDGSFRLFFTDIAVTE